MISATNSAGHGVKLTPLILTAISLLFGSAVAANASGLYPWGGTQNPPETLLNRLQPPSGFERTAAASGSFATWLRDLPLKPSGSPVKLYNGRDKAREDVHAAVIDIDTGARDLQQCADAVIVADVAENRLTKSKRFLLIQSYMPAQYMQVLKNPANGDGSPWYAIPDGELVAPEWTFAAGSLRRWP